MQPFGAQLALRRWGVWIVTAAVLICARRTDAQIILPAVKTSWGDTATVDVLQRVAFKPSQRLDNPDQWLVRIINAAKGDLMGWAAKPGSAADTCMTFDASVYTFSAPVDGQILVSLVPDERW